MLRRVVFVALFFVCATACGGGSGALEGAAEGPARRAHCPKACG